MVKELNPNTSQPPRTRTKDAIRARLSSRWMNAALAHSGLSPAEIKAIYDAGVKAEPVDSAEVDDVVFKKNPHVFERYATGERSMNIDLLPKFVKIMRENGALPPKDLGVVTPEEWILRRYNPSETIDDLREVSNLWAKRKKALEKALAEYIECIEKADQLRVTILETQPAREGGGCEAEPTNLSEVHSSTFRTALESIKNHQIIPSNDYLRD